MAQSPNGLPAVVIDNGTGYVSPSPPESTTLFFEITFI